VTFTGQRDDIREIYAVSDLVLSLSRRPESFGRTVLEALSLGVPVVGYAHGGVGEILGSIYPEGLVPVGDLGALVARVESLLVAPTAVPEEHPFTLDGMLRETIDTYLSLRAGDPT
jgi:glycosyltransferase involved in cell wall biosynthesis